MELEMELETELETELEKEAKTETEVKMETQMETIGRNSACYEHKVPPQHENAPWNGVLGDFTRFYRELFAILDF